MTDIEIIEKILAGDKDQYEVLVRKYNQRLYRIGKGYLVNDEEIEDVMQDAYIKAYQQLVKFENKALFSTWLTRIFINEALQKIKQKKKLVSVEITEENLSERFIDKKNPESRTMNNELKTILERSIERLPEKYKTVFILREIEHLSTNETCQALDITESNVKVRLNRAKEILKDELLSIMPKKELFEFNLVRCDEIVKNVLGRI